MLLDVLTISQILTGIQNKSYFWNFCQMPIDHFKELLN